MVYGMVWDSPFGNAWGDSMNKLSARFVETNKKPGLSNDGLGLYLKTQKTGAKSWIFRYASPVTHRKRDMGLGTYPVVSLAQARQELLHYGFIELTRQGGLGKCSLFAITWESVDDCDGKLDVRPTRTPSLDFQLTRPTYRYRPICCKR